MRNHEYIDYIIPEPIRNWQVVDGEINMSKNIYKEHPFHKGIWVSKSGQIIKADEKELRVLKQHKSGHKGMYRRVCLNNKIIPVSHLVVETFIQEYWDKTEYEVDHIDGNPSNNKVNNLRILSIRENRQNVVLRFKPVKITNIKTGEVTYAKSGIDAAELLNTQRYYVSNALKQKKSILKKTYNLEYADRTEAKEYFNQLEQNQ